MDFAHAVCSRARAFVTAEFGDLGDRAFPDIYKEGDIWAWLDGPFAQALFDSDLDTSGSMLLYNRLVGAVRLRRARRLRRDVLLRGRPVVRERVAVRLGGRRAVALLHGPE